MAEVSERGNSTKGNKKAQGWPANANGKSWAGRETTPRRKLSRFRFLKKLQTCLFAFRRTQYRFVPEKSLKTKVAVIIIIALVRTMGRERKGIHKATGNNGGDRWKIHGAVIPLAGRRGINDSP